MHHDLFLTTLRAPGRVEYAPAKMHRRGLIATVLAAAALGVVLGLRGVFPFGKLVPATDSTPAARVGYVLRNANVNLSGRDSAALQADIDAVRAAWSGETPAFDLVVALRGLATHGEPDFTRAAELCHTLRWPRCDRPALEEIRKRSRP